LLVSGLVPARERNSTQQTKDAIQEQDPLNRPRAKDQRAARERESKHYRDWLRDVSVIITDEELGAFRKLGTDAERDQFIYQFWFNRDPTPDTEENEYKDEFYRRKAYANEHYSAGIAGERTDRGRIYILYGKPDSVESHPMGGPYLRSAEEGGGVTETHPFEVWRYRHLEGIGEVTIEFVDACGCGEYRRTINRSDKDALKNIPNAGPTDAEMLGLSKKADRLIDPMGVGQTLFGRNNGAKIFDQIGREAALERPPALRAVTTGISHIIHYNLLHFDVRVDFVKAPMNTVVVPITVQVPNRELTFVNKDGVQRGVVNISGQMTTLTGRVAQSFEDTVRLEVPAELLDKVVDNVALYWKALPMRPGHYLLNLVLKDVNGDKLGSVSSNVVVPEFSPEKLTASSLILADLMEPVSAADVGGGNFVIGPDKVRPKVGTNGALASFRHNQSMNLWMQVYNLARDEKTGRLAGTIEYQVVNSATGEVAMDIAENLEQMRQTGDQVTLQKRLPLNALLPGKYQVTVRVNDVASKQTISPTARFAVE